MVVNNGQRSFRMSRFAIVFVSLSIALLCTSDAGNPASVRDGSTMEKAIIVRKPGKKAVDEERRWMLKIYPVQGLVPLEQALLCNKGILYDYWLLSTPVGKKELYFDLGVRKDICNAQTDPTMRESTK